MGLRDLIARWKERLLPAKSLGRRGEDAAARFLRRRGYHILAQDDRSRAGEIDLIAVDRGTVVFVEVKTRTSAQAGHPTSAITPEKQRRLTRAAVAWLKRRGLLERRARFDVVAVIWPEQASKPSIEHFIDAFPAEDTGGLYS